MRKTLLYILFLLAAFFCLAVLPAQTYAMGASPLSLTYSGGTGAGESTSKFSENAWSYKYQYHVFVLSGDLPQGRLSSQFQVEERDYMAGLGYAHAAISGGNYAIDLGDNIINFSDLTFNSLGYQGASVNLKPASNLALTVVGGSRGNGMWGADVRRDSRPKETFTGLRSVYSPWEGFGLSATYLTAQGGTRVLSYGSEYTFKDMKLGLEYGSAADGKALRGEVRYQSNWLSLGTIFRDIDSTYIVPFDYVGYKGMKGTYSSLGIRPTNDLSINIQSDSYLDRANGTPEALNLDTRGDFSYSMPTGTNIGYSGWRNDRQSYERGGITEGEIMYITQTFYLLTRNAIYYRYQPTWFTSASPSEDSYSENKNIAGINISLFDVAHLNYEIENTFKILRSTDITVNPSAITARFDLFENQIMESPFHISSSVNYRTELPDKESKEESISLYSDLTLKYIPGSDLNCFITARIFNMNSPAADRTAREQKDLSFGLTYSFNTDIFLK